ncbi:MAG: MMPL family transporter, partial [Verrucomicrobiales bacterium]|nr:MMPL family transporter [Verrucomicrobiales bacterium]
WQRANQHEFIMQLREALDPQNTNKPIITGTPVQLYEYTGLLKRSYEQAAAYAFVVIAVLVFIHFRSVLPVGLALTPVFIGGIWLVGLMGALGLQFNPANIMTLPLIVGIGVTNGIHILNRIMEETRPTILQQKYWQGRARSQSDHNCRIRQPGNCRASRHLRKLLRMGHGVGREASMMVVGLTR